MTTKKSGIYKITNSSNGKIYIGSAYNLSNRFSVHRYTLRNNKNKNKHLQAAWNKYGEQNFIFEIIELVDIGTLLQREQYWIDNFTPFKKEIGYNIAKIAGNTAGIKPSEATRKKQSESAKKRPKRKMSEEDLVKLKERYKGKIPPWAKLTWAIVNEIRDLYQQGFTQGSIAKKFQIGSATVSEIIRNIIWKNENYVWVKKINKKK